MTCRQAIDWSRLRDQPKDMRWQDLTEVERAEVTPSASDQYQHSPGPALPPSDVGVTGHDTLLNWEPRPDGDAG